MFHFSVVLSDIHSRSHRPLNLSFLFIVFCILPFSPLLSHIFLQILKLIYLIVYLSLYNYIYIYPSMFSLSLSYPHTHYFFFKFSPPPSQSFIISGMSSLDIAVYHVFSQSLFNFDGLFFC